MKFILLNLQTGKTDWSDRVFESYSEKINHFINFEIKTLKVGDLDRGQKEVRLKKEADLIFKFLDKQDLIVVLDEKGTQFDSLQFSKEINYFLLSGKRRIIFIVGGPFGVDIKIKQCAHKNISLSKLTFNHLFAESILLEQIYRAFTILKNIPYHNE